MNVEEKLTLLDENKLMDLINKNPFFKEIIEDALGENVTPEKIIKKKMNNSIWLYDGDLQIDGDFHSGQDLPEEVEQLFVNGDINIKGDFYMANMDIMAVSGSINAKSTIFQNVILLVEENITSEKGSFFGDTRFYTEVRGEFSTPLIMLVANGKFKINTLSKDTLGIIGYNSHQEQADTAILSNMGLKTMMVDEFPAYEESGNSFGTFEIMCNTTN